MNGWRLVVATLGFGAAICMVLWLAAQLLARWLIRDRTVKRAARAARAARHKSNGRG